MVVRTKEIDQQDWRWKSAVRPISRTGVKLGSDKSGRDSVSPSAAGDIFLSVIRRSRVAT